VPKWMACPSSHLIYPLAAGSLENRLHGSR
jgi:hypothetical protein